jgi:hypothetical protein
MNETDADMVGRLGPGIVPGIAGWETGCLAAPPLKNAPSSRVSGEEGNGERVSRLP